MKTRFDYPYLNSKLPLEERIDDLIGRMTIEEKIAILPIHQEGIPRLNVPEYNVGGEAAHGVVCKGKNATVFPQPIGLSSTWNEKLLKEIGSAIGDEARVLYDMANRTGGLTLWAPTIDMERDPRWGRTEEAYGEDPYLTGKLSSSLIKGMQGDDPFYLKLVPAPKHFYANNHEENRIVDSSSVDPRNKYEYYLEAFKMAYTEGKAYSMMTAYNEINGTPCIVNKEVQKIVKDTWGCDGFIVCDGGDMNQTVNDHKYFKTHAETIAEGLKSGIDCFTDEAELIISSAKEALERKLITEQHIDKALKNIFKVRFRLGQFDDEKLNPYSNIPKSKLCCTEHKELSLKAAKESIVLLKNENKILPLNKDKLQSIAVIGPLADVVYRDWYTGTHEYKVTPLQGIKNVFKGKKINYVSGNSEITISSVNGKFISVNNDRENLILSESDNRENNVFEVIDWGFGSYTLKSKYNNKYLTANDEERIISPSSDEVFGWFVKEVFKIKSDKDKNVNLKTWNDKYAYLNDSGSLSIYDEKSSEDGYNFNINSTLDGIEKAVEAAKNSETAIIFVGNNPVVNAKEEIDRKDIVLPEYQQELIKRVNNVNPNTIVVVIGSYPFAMNYENDNIPAIIYSAHGCQEIGNALSEVLFGNYSPAGRLSMTWYKSVEDLPDIKNYDIIKGKRTYMYFDKEVLYPFGYGLSYTNFKYSNLKISKKDVILNDNIDVEFDIQNCGEFNSDEVPQLYVHCDKSRVIRPIKELKEFKRINIKPRETVHMKFSLKISELAFWDVTQNRFVVEKGNYSILIGASSQDIRLKDKIFVKGETVPARNLGEITRAENYDDYHNVILHEAKNSTACVYNINKDGWICFKDVNFKNKYTSFKCKTSFASNECFIDILLDSIDGRCIGTVKLQQNGETNLWNNLCTNISPIDKVHDIYLKLGGELKIEWIKLNN